MKLQALTLAAALSMTSNAYALTNLDLVDAHYLGAFDGGELYGEVFTVAETGMISHSLTFNITGGLYAGSAVFDLSLGNITNIRDLTAQIFAGSSSTVYASFDPSPVLGNDFLILPFGTYFGVGNYTLKINGQATGTGAFGLPNGAYTIGAVTLPVPEPETYAMLLVGLGLVGLRLRQKNAARKQVTSV
jgi:hypothetical protein